jgi:hypothetical protein
MTEEPLDELERHRAELKRSWLEAATSVPTAST